MCLFNFHEIPLDELRSAGFQNVRHVRCEIVVKSGIPRCIVNYRIVFSDQLLQRKDPNGDTLENVSLMDYLENELAKIRASVGIRVQSVVLVQIPARSAIEAHDQEHTILSKRED